MVQFQSSGGYSQYVEGLSRKKSSTKVSSFPPSTFDHRSYDPEESIANSTGISSGSSRLDRKALARRASNVLSFLVIGVLCYCYHTNNKLLVSSEKNISLLKADIEDMRGAIEDATIELEDAHDSFHQMRTKTGSAKKDENFAHHEDNDDFDILYLTDVERMTIAKDLIDNHDKKHKNIEQLKKTIQDFHLRELERRFGKGPYYVEFEIEVKGVRMFITLLTAPNEIMPHSLYMFMDMVDNKVWDNSVFMHKWEHMVQAEAIQAGSGNPRDLSEYNLAFPEYSSEFNHEKYTVGFSGRPSETKFYINLVENGNKHGPGKQEHSTILNDADPCFAKVVHGEDALVQLSNLNNEAVSTHDTLFSVIRSAKRMFPSKELLDHLANK